MNFLCNIFRPSSKSKWTLSKTSTRNLTHNVDKTLQKLVRRALGNCEIEFGISSGYRTAEQQNALYRKGASKCDGYDRKSMHQFGLAVDVYAVRDGKADWSSIPYYTIASAFQKAGKELGVPIIWGGSWHELTEEDRNPVQLVEEYQNRKRRKGQKPFLDLVHFELVK